MIRPSDPPNIESEQPIKRSRRLRTIAILPTLFTLGNLFCGFFAIVVAARIQKPASPEIPLTTAISNYWVFNPADDTHNIMISGLLIFLAMVFDALDGHVARLANSASKFGAQLDSLCDAVTFGVAPGFLLVKMVPEFTYHYPGAIWIIAAVFPACAVLRLARFNVETGDHDDHSTFSGLPSPAAAASIAGFAILMFTLRQPEPSDWTRLMHSVITHALPFFALIVALLMVSRIPYPHVVNRVFRGRKSFGHLIGLLFALVGIMMYRWHAIPLVSCLFVIIPPIQFFWKRIRERQTTSEELF
jgi:CDP-diacylglycerol---serine O-phosphatidyltransferase